MRTKSHNQNRFLRIITLPIRVLGKARDFYVRSLTDCAERVGHGNTMGVPSGQISSLPKSFSVTSSRSSYESEDLRELIRAASTQNMGSRVEVDQFMQQQMRRPTAAAALVPRSCSVGMGRIDEDRPCEFGESNFNARPELLYPRCRSYAVPKRGVAF